MKSPAVVTGELDTPGFYSPPIVFNDAVLLLKGDGEYWITDWNARVLRKGKLPADGVFGARVKLRDDGFFAVSVSKIVERRARTELIAYKLSEAKITELERHSLSNYGRLISHANGVFVLSMDNDAKYISLPSLPIAPASERMQKMREQLER